MTTLHQRVQTTQELARAGILFAPASFLAAEVTAITDVVNGCGAGNAKFDFIPDTIYGVYVGYACFIHDWMYDEGRTIEDKKEADRVFLNNLLRIVEDSSGWYRPKWLMRRRAKTYYLGVKYFGGRAFWRGKN